MIYAPTSRAIEREQLIRLVEQWNENRLDLFSLSYPNEVVSYFPFIQI